MHCVKISRNLAMLLLSTLYLTQLYSVELYCNIVRVYCSSCLLFYTEKYSTASDVLAATHSKFTARVKQALENTAQQHSLKDSQAKDSTSPSTTAPTHQLLKGVSSALLERVMLTCHRLCFTVIIVYCYRFDRKR